jgi:small subunit ribosomal protein S3
LGQKVHPVGLRLGITKPWNSRWFSEKDYAAQLHEDLRVRRYIKERLSHAGVSHIEMERAAKRLRINIHTARPGIIIGKKGVEIDKLMKHLQEYTGKEVFINIMEVRKPEIDAQLVAENIALQIERRVAFRRAMKRAVLSATRFGADGVRVATSGRLAGHEIARREWYREGQVPLHTLRANIDYGFAEAKTTYGIIGIKVWIYKGEKARLGAPTQTESK